MILTRYPLGPCNPPVDSWTTRKWQSDCGRDPFRPSDSVLCQDPKEAPNGSHEQNPIERSDLVETRVRKSSLKDG